MPTAADSVPSSRLALKVQLVLNQYYRRPPNTRDDTPWNLLHWSIAYGVDSNVCAGRPGGEQVSAIGWLCSNYPAAGQQLISPTDKGVQLPIAAGVQGHHGQFLAMLAQSQVRPDYAIRVGGRKLTVADLVAHERLTCQSDIELTFKLVGLAYYVKSDEVWMASRGEEWSVRRILEEELRKPINASSTCGGTHRLFALSWAGDRRRREGLPIDGPWKLAERRVQDYQRRAFQLQNSDGSFSTAWLGRRESSGDRTTKLTTSGHVLEWLAFSLPEEGLHDPRFERAVEYVARLLDENLTYDWNAGALGHALHALAIYEQRVLAVQPGNRRKRLGWQ